jgi:hypothetical protein
MLKPVSKTAAALAALLACSPAIAGTVSFAGSFQNVNPPASLGGRCAPARTVNIGGGFGPASGTSSLGAFIASTSHCIVPPLPTGYTDGIFSFDFGAGDLLTGTYDGVLSATANPGVFANVQNFLVTGGAGRLLGASGAFTGTGTVTFAPGQLPFSDESLVGQIAAPGISEPASWAMLILGFVGAGAAIRRRRSNPASRAPLWA